MEKSDIGWAIGLALWVGFIISVFIGVIAIASKYVRDDGVKQIQENYILYENYIYKKLDIENVNEILGGE